MGKNKHKKKKQPRHVTYNHKVFVAPDSINSMSAIHAKIKEDGMAIIRISDCNGSIRWWNDMNDPKQIEEMLTKLDNASAAILKFRKEVAIKSKSILT